MAIEYYGTGQKRLEYDLILAAQVNPASVTLGFDGIQAIYIDTNGSATLKLRAGGEIQQPPPVAYQADATGVRTPVAVRYEQRGDHGLGFVVGAHDDSRSLVIDPQLVYSTYLGGTGDDEALSVGVDSAGNTYVAGDTSFGLRQRNCS